MRQRAAMGLHGFLEGRLRAAGRPAIGLRLIDLARGLLILVCVVAAPALADERADIVRYGGDRDFAPFESNDAQGRARGFQIDLLEELARRSGLRIEVTLDDWSRTEAAFRDGRLDLIAMSRTRERAAWANFLPEHATPALAVYHRAGDKAPQSLADLEGKRIATLDHAPMRETLTDFFAGDRFHFTPHTTARAALEAVRNGSCDVALLLRAYGDPLLGQDGLGELAAASFNVRLQGYAFATQPGNAALADRLSRALDEIERSGRLEALRTEWLSSHRGERAQAQLHQRIELQWIAGGLLALVAAALLIRLVRRLRARTVAMRAERARREETERALRAAEQRFRQSFMMHPDGMAIVEADVGTLLEVNPALCAILGQPRERIVDRTIDTLPAIESPEALAALRQMLRASGRLDAAPLQVRRGDGDLRDCIAQCDYFDLDARRCVFVIVRDVSEQTRAQAAFRKGYDALVAESREQARALAAAREGAAEAQREAARFTHAVAHDLKAPVRAIRGVTVFVRDDISRGALDSALSNVDRIDRAAIRMDALISGLSRLSLAEEATLRHERIDMQSAARETWELVACDAGRVVSFTLADLPPADGDAQLVLQVWQNLLGNAHKYTGRSTDAKVGVDSFIDGGRCWYRVTDNGAGFDMSHAEGLFQPFRRMHSEREFPGTGVGLSIAQRIVRRHGGEIRARSAVGVGSVFEFTLDPAPVAG